MCLVIKATYVDREKPLREGAFSFAGIALFPPLDKRNIRDEVKGLRVTSERYIGELSVRRLSTLKWIVCNCRFLSLFRGKKRNFGTRNQ